MFIQLVDSVPQLMASLKGLDGRYAYVNTGFSQRVGLEPASIIGATVHDLFAADLASSYARQDESVLTSRRPLTSHLELIVRADRSLGWYVTSKATVQQDGDVIGLSALSIDLNSQLQSGHAGLAGAIAAVRHDMARPWRVSELAEIAHLSPVQLERRCRRTLGLSPRKLLQRLRLEHAVHLITTTDSTLGDIASACGFYDQSSFIRQFRFVLGLTPGAYRSRTERR
jgi:PAS domain S-box-containing protein